MSKPTVTLHPDWPVYRGETVTLRCEIQGGEETQWMYKWRPANKKNSPTSSEYRINRVSESDSGEYSCMAKRGLQLTEWSDAFTLTVRYGARGCTPGEESPLFGSPVFHHPIILELKRSRQPALQRLSHQFGRKTSEITYWPQNRQ
ncbi:hypothetical protein CCH79_00012820, partial [Gambusia affinis]